MNRLEDRPSFRIWPPVALGIPLVIGVLATAVAGDPFALARAGTRDLGLGLCAAFAVWNGWTLITMAAHRTAVLPGGATRAVLVHGPFRFSRNPLYVGLIALDIGIALLWPSTWALLLTPVGIALLVWGAILPEERYLSERFKEPYDAYRHKVRRWL